MTTCQRALLFAIPLMLLASIGAPNAAPKGSWDGTWTGLWQGQYDSSITIAKDRVVRYIYRDHVVPIGETRATGESLSFGQEFTLTLTRTGPTTAAAQYHGSNGDFTAELTRR